MTTAVAGLAAAMAAVSVAASVRARRAAGRDSRVVVLGAGVLLCLVLVFVDHHAVLSWSFGAGTAEARVPLPGVGVALGVALLAAVGGTLLLGGGLAAPGAAAGAGTAAKMALWGAVVAGATGVGLAVVQLLGETAETRGAGSWSVALVAVSTAALALSLRMSSGSADSAIAREVARAALATRVAVALALVAAVAAGLEGWGREGTYVTGLAASSAAAVLLGLAALEPLPRFAILLRVLLVSALLAVLAG